MRLSDMWDGDMIDSQPTWNGDLPIKGVTCDSRRVENGFLFAAIPGLNHDGREFIADALAKGAAAILAPPGTRLPDGHDSVPLLDTDNLRRRYALLAARFYEDQPETIAAVTGTNGKTSVVHFLRQIWAHAGLPAASAGTLGIQSPTWSKDEGLTTPDPSDLHADLKYLANQGVDHLALEASSHGLDQHRLDGVKISAAAFTNLSRDHLDYHGSEGTYFAAKQRLFQELINKNGTAVVCIDDAHGPAVVSTAEARGLKVITYGETSGDVVLVEALPDAAGQCLTVRIDGVEHRVILPLAGHFQALNALCAYALATVTGVGKDVALSALAMLKGAPGRMEYMGRSVLGGAVYVDYAHTPDALANVLTALRPHTTGKLTVVFGCGGDRDRGKRPEMGRIATELADRVVVTDDNPRGEHAATIRQEILVAAPNATEIGDRRDAIKLAIADLTGGDVLVIAGKGHERGQIVGAVTLSFDDREEARRALAAEG